MNNDLISVIVPVYNVEDYIDRCLESIISQTYENLDIILVDDGSTDRSGEICDAYALRDGRITVVHKENGGLVSARKAGAQIARGNFCTCVDSDDWIEKGMIQYFCDIMQKYDCDLVSTHCVEEVLPDEPDFSYGLWECEKNDAYFYKNMILDYLGREQNNLPASMWGKFYRTEKYKISQSIVDDRISFGEDNVCVWHYLLNSKAVYLSDQRFYHYKQREGSISCVFDPDKLYKFWLLYDNLRDVFNSNRYSEVLLDQLDRYIIRYRYERDFKTMLSKNRKNLYSVPYDIIGRGSRIIIYGAGTVGVSYYKQLTSNDYCEVIGWVDSKVSNNLVHGSISELGDVEYDHVIIAVLKQAVANDIRYDLVKQGVDENKILWKEPRVISKTYFEQ